ncbi:stage II sporulation protein D [Cohnella cholangitidis]|uniref:Stage II sporulation protein D n=1 Tax=Cohnella cholangitidis TaxID=2598458 RepID=A0A7G5BXQ5_9BACL|nr:stage II sporulation protein D [Cohnella cholangitidis]QMV41739.1 stage II sporulation protein D [Cohnella cholangitidis]
MSSRVGKRQRASLHLWFAFVSGLIASTMIWVALHGGGNSSSIEIGSEKSTFVQKKVADRLVTKNEPKSVGEKEEWEKQPEVRVLLSESNSVEAVPLETYVQGVVAAEMPINFEPAALEAQALAARTYIVRRLLLKDRTGMNTSEADVTNTQTHQVYRSLAEMKRLRKDDAEGWGKVKSAVARTAGEIIVYRGEPIEALFFSTSNGYTENSEEVFANKLPYLRSVASPWDKEGSPRARETIEMELADFYRKLDAGSITANVSRKDSKALRILEWTAGKRVKEMLAGERKWTGEEVRHRLGLRSAAFDWIIDNDKIILTTYGSGHGVGMSQWGAQGMAKAGKTAREIVEYYYSGAAVEEVSKLANGLNYGS